MATDPKREAVIRLIESAWHEDDFSVASEVLAEDFVDNTAGFPEGHGPGAFEELVRTVKAAFPDCRHPIDDVVVGDDAVAVRWRFVGTHEGAFLGLEPTGREVEIVGLEIFEFEDGRVVESHAIPDLLALLEQLGVESLSELDFPE